MENFLFRYRKYFCVFFISLAVPQPINSSSRSIVVSSINSRSAGMKALVRWHRRQKHHNCGSSDNFCVGDVEGCCQIFCEFFERLLSRLKAWWKFYQLHRQTFPNFKSCSTTTRNKTKPYHPCIYFLRHVITTQKHFSDKIKFPELIYIHEKALA